MSERAKRKHEKANNGKVTINRRRTSKKQCLQKSNKQLAAKKRQASCNEKATIYR